MTRNGKEVTRKGSDHNFLSVAPCWRSPMWRLQAEAEGLTLLVAHNKAGYYGVYLKSLGKSKPYEARVSRGGKVVHLGCFAIGF